MTPNYAAMTRAQLQAALDADPEMEQIRRYGLNRGNANASWGNRPGLFEALQALQNETPGKQGWTLGRNGQLAEVDHQGWGEFIGKAALGVGAVAAGGYGLSAALGSGAAAGAGAGAALGPSTAANIAATSAAGAVPASLAAGGAGVAVPGIGSTLIKYGLEYGLPTVANYLTSRSAANAQREGDQLMAEYYNRALDAAIEDQNYNRGVATDERRYGRYGDSFAAGVNEDDTQYGRASDTYGRLSDEEILAYDRAQDIRDKNYGRQQYGNFVETLEPYRAGGASAMSRMSQLVGGPAVADRGSYLNLATTARNAVQNVPTVPDRPSWDFTPNRPTWNPPVEDLTSTPPLHRTGAGTTGRDAAQGQPTSSTMPVGGGRMVRLEAPTGEVSDVPEEQAAYFERLGARRVA